MLENLFLSLVLPIAVGAAVLAVAWQPWRRDAATGWWAAWGGAASPAAAVVAACLAADRWPAIPPAEHWQWIVWLVLGALVLALADSLRPWPAAARGTAAAALACACGWLLIGLPDYRAWRYVLAGVVLALLAGLDAPARRGRGASVALPLVIAAIGASVVVFESGNAKLARICGVLAATVAVAAVLGWWRPQRAAARGLTAVFPVAYPALILSAYVVSWSEIPAWAYVVAALAPLGVLVGLVPAVAARPPWQAAAVRVAAVLVPTAVAAVTAMRTAWG